MIFLTSASVGNSCRQARRAPKTNARQGPLVFRVSTATSCCLPIAAADQMSAIRQCPSPPPLNMVLDGMSQASIWWRIAAEREEEACGKATSDKCFSPFSLSSDFYKSMTCPCLHRWLLPCLPAPTTISSVQDTSYSGCLARRSVFRFDCYTPW
jgi:hypothetical protein